MTAEFIGPPSVSPTGDLGGPVRVMQVPSIFQPSERPIGIAHRGSRLLWPENTATAFQGAVELGYRRLETDLRITADRILVCYHDSFLTRTTNGHGLVANITYDQLRRLDAGYRHRLDESFPFRGQGIGVSTFAEMAQMFPGVGWVLDLKADGTEEPLTEVLEELELTDRVIVGSFSNERVDKFRRLTAGKVATSTPPAETLRAHRRRHQKEPGPDRCVPSHHVRPPGSGLVVRNADRFPGAGGGRPLGRATGSCVDRQWPR